MSITTEAGFWVVSPDGEEFIVLSLSLLDKADAEGYSKIADKCDAIGCTTFILNREQIKILIESTLYNTELMGGTI